jgi:hypothetical protein
MRTIAILALATLLPAPAGAFGPGVWGMSVGAGGWTQEYDYAGETLFDPSETFLGFTAGAWIDLDTGPAYFEPRLEVLYQQRGVRDEAPRLDIDGQVVGSSAVTARGHYLSVPLLLKLQKPGVEVTPYVSAGVGLEILLGYADDTLGIFQELDPVSAGLHIVTGLEFRQVGVQARFFRDLTNTFPGVEGATLQSVYNQGASLLLTAKLGP